MGVEALLEDRYERLKIVDENSLSTTEQIASVKKDIQKIEAKKSANIEKKFSIESQLKKLDSEHKELEALLEDSKNECYVNESIIKKVENINDELNVEISEVDAEYERLIMQKTEFEKENAILLAKKKEEREVC